MTAFSSACLLCVVMLQLRCAVPAAEPTAPGCGTVRAPIRVPLPSFAAGSLPWQDVEKVWGARGLGFCAAPVCRRLTVLPRDVAAASVQLGPRKARVAMTSKEILREVKTVHGADVNILLENLGGTRRRISGGLRIEAPPRAIWDILTNYNALNEYIPNIAASGAVLQPNGRVRIEQVGVISPTLRLTTRIVLEVKEEPYRKLTFSKVESREFLEFEGTYTITKMQNGASYLEYSVEALPLPLLPIALVQGKIRQEVPPMLAAVRSNANKYHQHRIRTQGPAWTEDLPVPASESYRRRIDSKNDVGDDRPLYSVPGVEERGSQLYTLNNTALEGASLPFTSIAGGLLQAVVQILNLLPGFKPLPGSLFREKTERSSSRKKGSRGDRETL